MSTRSESLSAYPFVLLNDYKSELIIILLWLLQYYNAITLLDLGYVYPLVFISVGKELLRNNQSSSLSMTVHQRPRALLFITERELARIKHVKVALLFILALLKDFCCFSQSSFSLLIIWWEQHRSPPLWWVSPKISSMGFLVGFPWTTLLAHDKPSKTTQIST